jgi:hypothetical protein
MNILSQRDPRWANKPLGTNGLTIGDYGCLITCLAMLTNNTPDYVNNHAVYKDGDLVVYDPTCRALGIEFKGFSQTPLQYPCIARTTIGRSMHFIIVLADGTQIDPWVGRVNNVYKVLEYVNTTNLLKEGEGMVFDEAKDRALSEAFYGESPWAKGVMATLGNLDQGNKDRFAETSALDRRMFAIESVLKAMASAEALQEPRIQKSIEESITKLKEELKALETVTPVPQGLQLTEFGTKLFQLLKIIK